MASTATKETVYAPPKGSKKVTVFPKIEFDAEDVPELVGKPTDYECNLSIHVKKLREGKDEYAQDQKTAKNKIKVEVTEVNKASKSDAKEDKLDAAKRSYMRKMGGKK